MLQGTESVTRHCIAPSTVPVEEGLRHAHVMAKISLPVTMIANTPTLKKGYVRVSERLMSPANLFHTFLKDDYIVKTLSGHKEPVLCVKTFGNFVVSGSCDGTVKL